MIEISCGCVALDRNELPTTPVLVASCSRHGAWTGVLHLRAFKRGKYKVLSDVEEHNVLLMLNRRMQDGAHLQRLTSELRELLGRV